MINGEQLEFEDLFTKDTDVYTIIRKMLYTVFIASHENHFFDEADVQKTVITENDIKKEMKKVMESKDKKFYFSPSYIIFDFNFDEYGGMIYLKDIADQVVIYDKFRTKESIFERNDIGTKNIWTCHKTIESDDRKEEYGFAEPNLYYEIYRNSWNVDVEKEFLSKKGDELIDKKMEEYKKIAKDNPNNFYILHLDYNLEMVKYNNDFDLIATNVNDSVFCVDIKNKDKAIDKMLEAYRYYNWGFYQSPIFLAFLGGEFQPGLKEIEFERISGVESKVFIKQNMKEIFGLEDLFDDGVDYRNLVKGKFKIMLPQYRNYKDYTDEQLEELLNTAEYRIDASGIRIKIPEEFSKTDYYVHEYLIEFSEFDENDLKFNEYKKYIIPDSNTRKIEEEELSNFDLDELNKAYNEIFARYGHEFKSKDLKEYFESKLWYVKVPNKVVSIEELNETEKYNLNLIKDLISKKKAE